MNNKFGSLRDQKDDLYDEFDYPIDSVSAPPKTAAPKTAQKQGGMSYGIATSSIPPGTAQRPPPSQMGRMQTGAPQSRMNTAGGSQNSEARPMTSVSGAGFSSDPSKQKAFDPLKMSNKGPAPALSKREDNSPEDKAREMERQVNKLLEESAALVSSNKLRDALDKAKEAGKKERALVKYREQNGLVEQINLDLTYAIYFNLANGYHLNQLYEDALNAYSVIVKNKQYPQAGRLRVNMGNIYFEQKKYSNAIKMYRMALDQIPTTANELRYKIMRNIGIAFIRLGQYQDAIQSFESVMQDQREKGDFQAGFNLVVCFYALGDTEKMRKWFSRLLSIPIPGLGDNDEEESKRPEEEDIWSDMKPDPLRLELKERQKEARNYIITAAKLIAPVLDKQDWVAGYDHLIETLKPQHEHIASEMELCKALQYLKHKKYEQAIEVLRSFEKKDPTLQAMAATNLSFLYFLEGDFMQADKYANLAMKHDRYNAQALVNKGNCLFNNNELERAKELFLEAIGVEADCVEAIYNLGLVNKRMGILNESLQAFEKLHSIIPTNTEVIYQIAHLHDVLGNYRQSAKWFNILMSCNSTNKSVADPGVLARLGQIFNKDEDESQAFHYHLESYRHYPVNLDVISWLGVWYVKSEYYEKAIQFFQRASEIQPQEVKWKLMVTSCYRRMGNYQRALQLYEEIHNEYPDNLECLRYLVAICKDLGHPFEDFQQQLIKLERQIAAKTQQAMSPSNNNDDGTASASRMPSYVEPSSPERFEGDSIDARTPAASPEKGSNMSPPRKNGPSSPQPASPQSKVLAPAPLVRPMTAKKPEKPQQAKPVDDDDFADADVSDLLA